RQKAFVHLGYQAGDFPVSEKVSQQIFSIPMHPYLRDDQISTITDTLIGES
ncbi:MAG: DegT/DnrJ/EryC1/StrS family aminotransferase, partial [Fidelibacterota bacterium]